MLGIYAGDCKRLSLQSCFPLFHQWEQEQGSLFWGAWNHRTKAVLPSPFIQSISRFPLFSFKEGMETLPHALANRLADSILFGQAVRRLLVDPEGMEVELENGNRLRANHVISTLPTSDLASLIPSYPQASAQLNRLRYTSVIVVNLGFDGTVIPLKGFGYLVPSEMNSPILGCVWDSCIFPQQNSQEGARLTVMIGGSHHPEMVQMSDSEIIELTLEGLHEQIGLLKHPQEVQIKRALHAIPQYELGYQIWKEGLLTLMHKIFPHLTLSGVLLPEYQSMIASARHGSSHNKSLNAYQAIHKQSEELVFSCPCPCPIFRARARTRARNQLDRVQFTLNRRAAENAE